MNIRWLCACVVTLAVPALAQELKLLRSFPQNVIEQMRGRPADTRGFVGSQQTSDLFQAGYQRGGMYTLTMGVVLKKPDWIEEGLRVAAVTFDHQNADGSLGDLPTGRSTTNAFFLCWFSRAMLVLEESEFVTKYKAEIAALKPKARRAVDWLSKPEQIVALGKENGHAPNRCLISAVAFGLSRKFVGDKAPGPEAEHMIDLGMAHFRSADGVFVERGGGDSSYQAVSVLILGFYTSHFPDARLRAAMHKGAQWEMTKILPDGNVTTEGNTRTGVNKEPNKQGAFKGLNFGEIVQSMFYTCKLLDDPRGCVAGARVFARHYPGR
ncbi:MAG: hypothetical protein ABI823_04770 [Bryobacteraceae bacterium]